MAIFRRLSIVRSTLHWRARCVTIAGALGLASTASAQVRAIESVNLTPQGASGATQVASELTTLAPLNEYGLGNNHAAASAEGNLAACRFTATAHGCNTLTGGLYPGGDVGHAQVDTLTSEPYRLQIPGVEDGTVVPVKFRTSIGHREHAVTVEPIQSASAVGLVVYRTVTRSGFTFAETGQYFLDHRGNETQTGMCVHVDSQDDNEVTLNLVVGLDYNVSFGLTIDASVSEYSSSSNADIEVVMTWSIEIPGGTGSFINLRTGHAMCGTENTQRSFVDSLIPPPPIDTVCDLAITRQPNDVSACPSSTAVFTIAAGGAPSIDYRWQIEQGRGIWVNLTDGPVLSGTDPLGTASGSGTDTLRVALNPGSHDTQRFRCIVTNPCVRLFSEPGTLRLQSVCCLGDFNHDSGVNSQDFFDFLSAFFTADPTADVNHDGLINSQDYFDFLARFFAGC